MLFGEAVVIKQNYPHGLIYSTVFQMFMHTDPRGEDLSHRSGQATARELETFHGLVLSIKPMPGGTTAGALSLLLPTAILYLARCIWTVGLSCDAGPCSCMYFVFFTRVTCATLTPSSHGTEFIGLQIAFSLTQSLACKSRS